MTSLTDTALAPPVATPQRIRRGRVLDRRIALGFFLPAFVLVAAVSFVPLGYAIVQSLFRSDFLELGRFVGLANYEELLLTQAGWTRAWNSMVFTLATLVFTVPLGMGLALLLDQPIRGRGFYRTILIMPWLVSNIAAALLWSWVLNAQFGPLAYALSTIGVTLPNLPTSLDHAMSAVVLVNVWSTYPLIMVFTLAALQTIPSELQDAAAIDGANPWQRFWSVTLPAIRSTTLVAIVLTTLWSFNMVTIILVMTGGGPLDATDTMAFNVWEEGFRLYRMGVASAGAVIIFALNIAFTLGYMRVLREERR